jgi:taurine transport system substrate-binding protein
VKAVAKWTKADPKDVPPAMALYTFPTAEQQLSANWLGGGAKGGAAKAMHDTAVFLKEQGRIQEVKPDYGAFVNTTFLQKALGK